ncbi:hypothetical protein V8C86DRAFT_2823575, partial [Haematococcus lacustris]
MLGMITVLLLGCAAWAAALAASIATTLDATSPATTAETSAGNISRNSSLRAPQSQQKPGPYWVKWAIRKERSDAAARQNETQRQFDYVASAPAHEQLLTSKRAALQAAMQEQLDL